VIVFGFKRDESGGAEREVAAMLREAAGLAGAQGMTLLVENEPGCWCDSGSNTARMIESAGSPFLKANWDTANAVGQGEAPFPDGYEHIRNYIGGVHIKDTRTHTLDKCVPVGEGVVDWRGQLEALVRDGQVDVVTVETHCLPLVAMSKRNIDHIRVLLGMADARKG
jgi:sugar phosphate isomerase/epimerase